VRLLVMATDYPSSFDGHPGTFAICIGRYVSIDGIILLRCGSGTADGLSGSPGLSRSFTAPACSNHKLLLAR
jgi:hypothetical protein